MAACCRWNGKTIWV